MRQFKVRRIAAVGVALLAVCAVMVPGALAKGHKTAKAADGNIDRGYVVFNQYFCADCHTLKAAGPTAYGQLGVNLNKVKVPAATVSAVTTNGLPAALPLYPTQMVGYKNVLTAAQIADVSAFVAAYSGSYKSYPPPAAG